MQAWLLAVFKRFYQYLIYRATDQVFYQLMPSQSGRLNSNISLYDKNKPIPPDIKALLICHSGRLNFYFLQRRLDRYGGFMLVYVKENVLAATGYIIHGRALRREYGWLGERWYCLGPYRTDPQFRGKGIYGEMLQHSIAECRKRGWHQAYIWANAENLPSIKGISRAGFQYIGKYHVTRFLGRLICRHHAMNDE